MSTVVVEAMPEHVPLITADVRQADIDELYAASEITPELAMWKGLAVSTHAWVGFIDHEPVCMFGVVPRSVLSGRGIPWMIGTNALDRHAAEFLKGCRPQVAEMRSVYNLLENYVDARNTKAIRWLRWLGFEIGPAQPHGPHAAPFHYFKLETNDV